MKILVLKHIQLVNVGLVIMNQILKIPNLLLNYLVQIKLEEQMLFAISKLDLDDKKSYSKNFNKISYITADGIRRNYNEDMLTPTSNYTWMLTIDNSNNLYGFDMNPKPYLEKKTITNDNLKKCEDLCTSNNLCGGFYVSKETCYTKSKKDMFPNTLRQLNTNPSDDIQNWEGIFIRDMSLNHLDSTCNNTINDVNTRAYELYPQSSENTPRSSMTPHTKCDTNKNLFEKRKEKT